MSRQFFFFDQPRRFVVGTVGEPGERVFFLQASDNGRLVSVALEKTQVTVLAERMEQLLTEVAARLGADLPDEVEPDTEPLESPIDEEFRVSAMALAYDSGSVDGETAQDNSQPGQIVRIPHSLADLRRTGEELFELIGEISAFSDPEVVERQIQVQVDRVADRRHVGGAVPCRAHAEELAAVGRLARQVQAARGGDVHADEINPAIGDEREPLVLVHEKLAHGDGGAALFADVLVPRGVLGGEQILHEVGAVLFDGLGQRQRPGWMRALVDVVAQLHIPADGLAKMVERRDEPGDVRGVGAASIKRYIANGPCPVIQGASSRAGWRARHGLDVRLACCDEISDRNLNVNGETSQHVSPFICPWKDTEAPRSRAASR